ncbi:MAG: glycoside hydrolase family 6 protein [Actinomycetota bacterium]|nr:glycoside hydrolase family 6 protein [Actinomycetota bacterium]
MSREGSSGLRWYGAAMLAAIAILLSPGWALGATTTAGFEAETMSLASGSGGSFSDGAASGGAGLLVHANATATKSVTTTKADQLVVRARGDQCGGAPRMVVKVGGAQVLSKSVSATTWTDYPVSIAPVSGAQTVGVSFTNDYRTSSCDRNLRVDKVSFVSTAAPTTEPAPAPAPAIGTDVFEGTRLYVDPYSSAKRQADEWRTSRPEDARQMDKIAAGADADWFGDWSGDVRAAVDARVTQITSAGALPVLVAYDIPNRDCSGQSAGGASSPEAYKTWIRAFADGIGTRKAAVVIEPDAVALTSCLSETDRATRFALLKDAVSVLEAKGNVATYIDAGHSNWIPAPEMAARLTEAGVGSADGFSLNVSNFRTTSESMGYGKDVSARIGGKHFVIDTARNGLGPSPDNEWCNPPGRALGEKPGDATADPAVDAYLWIKPPGESDGSCNGGPPAGQWWAEYALGLAQRAAY